MMERPIERIVIAGGGTAGWLAAASLAAWSAREANPRLDVTLVEAPDIPTIGVGEGTWPTIRNTLADIGIDEGEFLLSCDATFKQGSRFDGWVTGAPGDHYYHPFTPPLAADASALVAAWHRHGERDFASAVSAQPAVCALDLAPRQRSMPPYAGALNYAYHFDAAKLVDLLRKHAVERLGVRHIAARITGITDDGGGGIASLDLDRGEMVAGDLFVDCTGLKSLLVGEHLEGGWVDHSHVMFNDCALAAQVPVEPESSIASQTVGTAQDGGWIWDIGLPTRRGIGCVYSSRFCGEEQARAALADYVARQVPAAGDYPVRLIQFPTGHRKHFWIGNCLAVGMAAGFIEPLEASAIVMVELSIQALTEAFPASRNELPFLADRFNSRFTTRWQRIVEFLKLHYVLSKRPGAYWEAHRDPASFPDRLRGLLDHWGNHPPSSLDLPLSDEIFPAASYQYVYYGMGGRVERLAKAPDALVAQMDQLGNRARSLQSALPTNRGYFDALATAAAPSTKEAAR